MLSFRSLCRVRMLALGCALLRFSAAGVAAPVDAQRIGAAADNRADWLTHGRTYDEQRFSPLTAINQGNVKDLKLAWYFISTPSGARRLHRWSWTARCMSLLHGAKCSRSTRAPAK